MLVSQCRSGWCVAVLASTLIGIAANPAQSQNAPAEEAKAGDTARSIDPGAAVLIVTALPGNPSESEAELNRRIHMHMVSLHSEQMLRRMISDPNSETRKTSWFTAAANPLERATWLHDHLRVRLVIDTKLIELTLPDVPNPRERVTILREIGEQYLRDAGRDVSDMLLDRTRMLNTMKIKIDARLKQVTDDTKGRAVQLNLEGGGVGRIGIKEKELSPMVSRLIDARIRCEHARRVHEGMVNLAKEGRPLPGVEALVENDRRLDELQRRLDDVELRMELANAAPAPDAEPADPLKAKEAAKAKPSAGAALAALKIESAFLKRKIETRSSDLAARAKVRLLEQAASDDEDASALLENVKQRLDNLKNDLADLNNAMVAYYALQDEQKSLRRQLNTVREKIEDAMALQSTPASSGIAWKLMPEMDPH